jgi:hypothetical protein
MLKGGKKMASKEKLDQAISVLNQCSDAQLDEFINMMEKKKEEGVFGQELSMDELDAAAGGGSDSMAEQVGSILSHDDDENDCTESLRRDIYGGSGFANCAATVENGSKCGSNDACYSAAVVYQGMDCSVFDCTKAWR